jgi:hypothetical protein
MEIIPVLLIKTCNPAIVFFKKRIYKDERKKQMLSRRGKSKVEVSLKIKDAKQDRNLRRH